MTYTFKLARRIARLRAPLLVCAAVSACAGDKAFDPTSDAGSAGPVASATFAGGIPFGISAMPLSEYGSRYNGALLNLAPRTMLAELAEIKSRGGKVIIKLAGHPQYYGEGEGFDLDDWKSRVGIYRGIDFSSYVRDGTIVGHYMIDEPNDPANWGGRPVPPSVLEEMGRYSKQLWPELPTIVRTEPNYLDHNHRYIDAAWAQYLNRKGTPQDFIRRNVSEAQERGLALIIGLNVLDGGVPNQTPMTPSEVQSWGSELLESTYPCAFISWRYEDGVYSSASMSSAMDVLSRLARNRSIRMCRRAAGGSTPQEPAPSEPSEPAPSEPAPTGTGVPFGPHGLPLARMGAYDGAGRVVTPDNVLATVRAARQAGTRLILRMAVNGVTNADGTFNLTRWKAAIDRYGRLDLASFATDGTIAGHVLVQNPQTARHWGGRTISYATLEEMARYSRQLWPAIPTLVDAPATWLARNPADWKHLDAASATYAASSGDAASWVVGQASAARSAGLGLLVEMNALNGGTSASGIRGSTHGRYAMGASQLRNWGSTILAQSQVCGLVLARYDAAYFGRSDIRDALRDLAAKARARTARSCRPA
jgi:hypothetical protein